jgi:hypothetical protein
MDFCSCKPSSFSRISASLDVSRIWGRRACRSWLDVDFRWSAGRVACRPALELECQFRKSPSTVKFQILIQVKHEKRRGKFGKWKSWVISLEIEGGAKKREIKVEFHTGFHIALHLKWQQASDLCGSISRGHWSLLLPRWSWHTTWRSRLHSLVH